MSTVLVISAIYSEFTAALTEVLAENAVDPPAVADLQGHSQRSKASGL